MIELKSILYICIEAQGYCFPDFGGRYERGTVRCKIKTFNLLFRDYAYMRDLAVCMCHWCINLYKDAKIQKNIYFGTKIENKIKF